MRKQGKRKLIFLPLFSLCLFGGLFSNPIQTRAEDEAEAEIKNEFEVHQLSLGAEGDCSLIKYGNCNILIDCGGSAQSAGLIRKNLEEYIGNDTLDYAIMTHSDRDHIVCVQSALNDWLNAEGKGGQKNRQIGMLVDFDITQDPTNNHPLKNSLFLDNKSYEDYKEFREKNASRIRHYLPASVLTYEKRGLTADDIKEALDAANLSASSIGDEFALSLNPEYGKTPNDDVYSSGHGADASIKFLYNYFYDHAIAGKQIGETPDSADKNIISVSTMLKLKAENGYKRILYNGDLEEYDSTYAKISSEDGRLGGESMLLQKNSEEFTDPITFYKSSHHGSNTSNDPAFLEKIRPLYIGINAVAGGRYKFPSDKKEMADSSSMVEMTRFTDRIFITDKVDDNPDSKTYGKTVPYYGNVVFKMSPDGESVSFQNPDDFTERTMPQSIFTEQSWFRPNRRYEADVANLTVDGKTIVNMSYVKLGSVDAIIGAGHNPGTHLSAQQKMQLQTKISQLCNDGVLDCLVLPGLSTYSAGLLDTVLDAPGIKKIKHCVYCAPSIENPSIDQKPVMDESARIEELLKNSEKVEKSGIASFQKAQKIPLIKGSSDYSLSFYGDPNTTKLMPSFYTIFDAEGYRYLNAGDNFRYDETDFIPSDFKNSVNTLQMAKCGEFFDLDPDKPASVGSFRDFYDSYIKKSGETNVMLNTALSYDSVQCKFNINVAYQCRNKLLDADVYVTKMLDGNGRLLSMSKSSSEQANGDLLTRALIKNGEEDVRVVASKDFDSFSISDPNCDRRSGIHSNAKAIVLTEEVSKRMKGK